MDPITQGVVGSLAARAVVTKNKKATVFAVLGGLSALAPDLDVFIRSSTDHLLFLEYHRQFTHSLFFIPIGSLICALFFWFFIRSRKICNFKMCFFACLVGYGSHGLIDSCTTYGTVLWWPFVDTRIAWSIISIIDPIFTGVIIIGLFVSIYLPSTLIARITFVFGCMYLLLGAYQNHRVTEEVYNVAKSRGHDAEKVFVKPSFGNLVVWRTVYLFQGHFYVDAIRASRGFEHFVGGTIKHFDNEKLDDKLQLSDTHKYDLRRFAWFTSDMLGESTTHPLKFIDVRYALLPNELDSIWFIEINEETDPNEHLKFQAVREDSWDKFFTLISMIFNFDRH